MASDSDPDLPQGTSYHMIKKEHVSLLRENEHIILTLHRHWIILVFHFLYFIALFVSSAILLKFQTPIIELF